MRGLPLFLAALTLIIGIATPAMAATPQKISESAMISTRGEQTEWRFRTTNGYLEKRLWSLTYNRWLTDWERVAS
ncbi:MAG: hypothetical protein EOM52_02975 [Clostridia bacterium]|nr:hypothetical protein [Clostridia bacterium]